ncbi:hypothetical protein CE195_12120 [Sodalis-like symbiont of Philaenus spumarius]|nr:hypothetical protein CE195_12120 [Sodalis-like symbiont of Philaenus spumarius]
MSYAIDFRCKVIFTLEDEGFSILETAKQFRIGSASVYCPRCHSDEIYRHGLRAC